jgi:hypothetical protein
MVINAYFVIICVCISHGDNDDFSRGPEDNNPPKPMGVTSRRLTQCLADRNIQIKGRQKSRPTGVLTPSKTSPGTITGLFLQSGIPPTPALD